MSLRSNESKGDHHCDGWGSWIELLASRFAMTKSRKGAWELLGWFPTYNRWRNEDPIDCFVGILTAKQWLGWVQNLGLLPLWSVVIHHTLSLYFFYFVSFLSVTLHLCIAFTQTEAKHIFRRAPSLTITWGSGGNVSYLEENIPILYGGIRNLVFSVCFFLKKSTHLPAPATSIFYISSIM